MKRLKNTSDLLHSLAFMALAASATAIPAASAATWQPSPGHVQIPIWPGTPPDALPEPKPETVRGDGMRIDNVSIPTMTVYPPKGRNTGVAMVVFPGGGYQMLAMGLEGTEVCDWLVARGITCVLLKYRVPDSGPTWKKGIGRYNPPVQTAVQDAQRALGLVRLHAAQWRIDPHKVGVIGFSAGGHLVAATSTRFDKRSYAPIDAADAQSCRPDFAIALYPGHLWLHMDEPRDARDPTDLKLLPDITVSKDTPPTFLLMAQDDRTDGVWQALAYYVALNQAGVPTEMHLYAQGGHAFGLRPGPLPINRWPALVETWLHTIGMLDPQAGG